MTRATASRRETKPAGPPETQADPAGAIETPTGTPDIETPTVDPVEEKADPTHRPYFSV